MNGKDKWQAEEVAKCLQAISLRLLWRNDTRLWKWRYSTIELIISVIDLEQYSSKN